VTVLFGIVCFFFMPDTPAAAGFLPDEEKEWALRRMRIDAGGSTDVDVADEKFSWYWAKMDVPFCFHMVLPVSTTLRKLHLIPITHVVLIASRAFHCSYLASSREWGTSPLLRSSSPFHPI
jgi:hypothetical protein